MITQQMLDYIQSQLRSGVSREQISAALVSGGWNQQDINEAFIAVGDIDSTAPISISSPATVMPGTPTAITSTTPGGNFPPVSRRRGIVGAIGRGWIISFVVAGLVLLVGGSIFVSKITQRSVASHSADNNTVTSSPVEGPATSSSVAPPENQTQVPIIKSTPTNVPDSSGGQAMGASCGTIPPSPHHGDLNTELTNLSKGPVFTCLGNAVFNGCTTAYVLSPVSATSSVNDVYQIRKQNGSCILDTVLKNPAPDNFVVTVSCPLSVFNQALFKSPNPPAKMVESPGTYIAALFIESAFMFIGLDIQSHFARQPNIPGCTITHS